MAQATIEQQFHGTAMLVVLHLRRLVKSNDIELGFASARELRMIDAEQERFMRECLALDEALQSGTEPVGDISPERIARLQACVLSINSADPA